MTLTHACGRMLLVREAIAATLRSPQLVASLREILAGQGEPSDARLLRRMLRSALFHSPDAILQDYLRRSMLLLWLESELSSAEWQLATMVFRPGGPPGAATA